MNPSYRDLLLISFLLGILTDFSETAEVTWYRGYSIPSTLWFGLIENFISHFGRILLAILSDRLLRGRGILRVHQARVGMLIPLLGWLFVSYSYNNDSLKDLCLLMLFVSKLGGVILMVYVDALSLEYNDRYDVQILPEGHVARLLGKMVAKVGAGKLLDLQGIGVIFLLQFIFSGVALASLREGEGALESRKPQETISEPVRTISFHFIVFMCISVGLPNAQGSFIYYVYDPTCLSSWDIGIIEAIVLLASIFFTLLRTLDEAPLNFLGVFVGILSSLSIGIKYVVATRLSLLVADDFHMVLLSSLFYKIGENMLFTQYCKFSSKCVKKGEEGKTYSILVTVPSMIGKFVRVSSEWGMNTYLGIDHNQFELLPRFLEICSYLSMIHILLPMLLLSHI